MSESLMYLRTVGDYWTRLGAKTLYRMQRALDDVETDAYTFQKLTLDVLGFYNDSFAICMGTGSPAPTTPVGPVPTLNITVPAKQDTASGKIALGLPAGTVLTWTDLLYIPTSTGTAKKIDQSSVTASVTASGELKVDVQGLVAGAIVGSYQGLVMVSGTPIAHILLQVT